MKNTKKTSRLKKGSGAQMSRDPSMLGSAASYKGQQMVSIKVKGNPQLLSTVVTTGVINNSYVVTNNNIQNFSSRFGNTWDEYRIIKAHFSIRPVSPTATGISTFFFDEKSSSNPTLLDSQEKSVQLLSNCASNSRSVYSMDWSARDVADLQFSPVGAGSTPVYFKTYTDSANWGSPAVVTPLWIIQSEFTVQFRGLKSS